ncbi:MAG TPA: ATPase [Bacteroidetes bacterium]|nr:ATPase [Bacteroidota bacterium]
MNKTIAIPLENGTLCAHFGHCQTFAIVKVENSTITDIKEYTPPEHVPGLYPRWVAQFGATDVIAGGMGQKAIQLFHQQSINVFIGAPMIDPKELVTSFIEDKLELSANYCNHDENHSHGCSH